MKAEKTTELIELSIAMNTGNVPYNPKQLYDLCFESDEELTRIEELASKYQSPETQRQIEIGRATEALYKDMGCLEATYGTFTSIDELIEWAAHEGKAGEGKE